MANKRNSDLHAGHRQRLKERALKYGLGSLSEHERLELLLFFAVARKDLNEPAHELLNTFGGFYNLTHSSRKDMEKINGIGKEASCLLTLMPEFVEWYLESKEAGKIKLSTATQSIKYFKSKFLVKDVEEAYIAMLDHKEELIKLIPIGSGNGLEVNIDEKLLNYEISTGRPKYVILFHTHPNGGVKPSLDDLSATLRMMYICKMHKSCLVEHIILNKDSWYSFKDEGLMGEFKALVDKDDCLLQSSNPTFYTKILDIIEKRQ